MLAPLHVSRALSIGSLVARFGWTSDELVSVLSRLVRSGDAEVTGRRSYRINPSLVPSGSILALEAKVRIGRRQCTTARRSHMSEQPCCSQNRLELPASVCGRTYIRLHKRRLPLRTYGPQRVT